MGRYLTLVIPGGEFKNVPRGTFLAWMATSGIVVREARAANLELRKASVIQSLLFIRNSWGKLYASISGGLPLPTFYDEDVVTLTPPEYAQWKRVLMVFSSPARLFHDLHSGTRYLLAYGLSVGFLYLYVFGFMRRLGLHSMFSNILLHYPNQVFVLSQLPAGFRQNQMATPMWVRVVVFLSPLFAAPLFALLSAMAMRFLLPLLFGYKAKFKPQFAAGFYAFLPLSVVMGVRGIMLILGVAPRPLQIPIPGWDPTFYYMDIPATNIGGYIHPNYLEPQAMSDALLVLADSIDLTFIWVMALLAIASSTLSGSPRGAAVKATLILSLAFLVPAIFALLQA